MISDFLHFLNNFSKLNSRKIIKWFKSTIHKINKQGGNVNKKILYSSLLAAMPIAILPVATIVSCSASQSEIAKMYTKMFESDIRKFAYLSKSTEELKSYLKNSAALGGDYRKENNMGLTKLEVNPNGDDSVKVSYEAVLPSGNLINFITVVNDPTQRETVQNTLVVKLGS